MLVGITAALFLSTGRWASAQASVVSAVKSGDAVVVESKGGALRYKVVVDGKLGGDITQLSLPANGPVIAREINDVFFLGQHGEEYTLRGWTGPAKFNISCNVDVVSQRADEVVVQVKLLTTGTFKILVTDEPGKTNLRKAHTNYKDKTLEVKRIYTFKADRVLINDELLWVHPDIEFKTFYFTAAFMPGAIQGPVRMVNGGTAASFYQTSSGGKKIPLGIAYPFTSENFLKNGFKVSVRNTAVSFNLGESDFYFYEKSWQQDWYQLSGSMYRIVRYPAGQVVKASHEVVFSKATAEDMPPVVTIHSPSLDARWMDEKGEVAKYRIGDTVKLSASAVNADGTTVADQDIAWEIHIDPWWNTPSVTLHGGNVSYTLPEVSNEVDRTTSKDRKFLGVINVKVKGKNGREAMEPFAMLVGNGSK
ncbi:MAG TPA: hypothetical protein VIM11_21825 [Tepidisphaeraceae bacterium]|jgi:hypothetical protein